MTPHSIFQDTMDLITMVGGSLQSIGEHVAGEGSSVNEEDFEDDFQQAQHKKGDMMVPFKSSCDDDGDNGDDTKIVEASFTKLDITNDDEDNNHDGSDDEDDMTSTISLATTTSCSTSTSTSSVCSASSTISTLQTRESQAMDTLYERMQEIFRYLQNSGIADASICELKQQLFSQHDTLLALERTQEYMALVCPGTTSGNNKNQQQETLQEKLNCAVLLEQAWIAGLTLLTYQHKCSYRQLITQKSMMVTCDYIAQTQEQVCLKAEQVTQCQTRLLKLKSLRKRLEIKLRKTKQ